MATLTTVEDNRTPNGPDSWGEVLVDKGDYGQLKVQRHVLHRGRQAEGTFDWWNYAHGWIRGEKCSIDTRAEPLVSNSASTYSLDGNGLRSIRLAWVPGPKFTADMTANVTVTLTGSMVLKSVISGNIESAAVAAGTRASISFSHFGSKTEKSASVTATTGEVEVENSVSNDAGVNGKAEQTTTLQGNAQIDATGTPTGGSVSGNQTTTVGGSVTGNHKSDQKFKAKRVGANPTIMNESVTISAVDTDVLSLAKLTSKPFATAAAISVTSESSGNDVAAECSAQLSTIWDFDVEVKQGELRLAAIPSRSALVDDKLAILRLVELGTPLSVAAAVRGVGSASKLGELMAVKVPEGYPRPTGLPGELAGFRHDVPVTTLVLEQPKSETEMRTSAEFTERLSEMKRMLALKVLGKASNAEFERLSAFSTESGLSNLDALLLGAMHELLLRGLLADTDVGAAKPGTSAAKSTSPAPAQPSSVVDTTVDPDEIPVD